MCLFEQFNYPGTTERSLVHFEAKNRCAKIWDDTSHSVGNKYGTAEVALYEAFNGPDGHENPSEKAILRDGINTNPLGDVINAELEIDLGNDPVIP